MWGKVVKYVLCIMRGQDTLSDVSLRKISGMGYNALGVKW